jgi:hypothetical protein
VRCRDFVRLIVGVHARFLRRRPAHVRPEPLDVTLRQCRARTTRQHIPAEGALAEPPRRRRA